MIINSIEQDPEWRNGDYTTEPKYGMLCATYFLSLMTSVPLQMQKNYPTRAAAEKYVDDYLARTMAATDANNMIYYINASRNYNPAPKLGQDS